ncbi:transposase [Sphingomonas sp. PWP1-2]|uniref:transposase n=1 Tax=Sphingomonas sp. PWP1-2 TaxID=2804558 RepID=UPI003CE9E85E
MIVRSASGPWRPPEENRSIITGIIWRLRCGTTWHDVPPRSGNWNTIYRRFWRWSAAGCGKPYRSRWPR